MNKTVMLVDDSSTVRKVLRFAFEQNGYAVLEAPDGEAALGTLQAERVHAVVCDVAMPKLDGLGFLKAMRALPAHRFTPVILLTTEGRAHRREEARDIGAQAWATKPCPPSELVALVRKLVV